MKPLNTMGLKIANAVSVFSLAILNGLARYIRQKDMQPNDLYCNVGGTGCVSTDDQPRHCSYNVLTPPVSMELGSPSSPTFTFKTTCPWRHDISEAIDGHYDSSNTIGITYETDASTYYNWWPHNNL